MMVVFIGFVSSIEILLVVGITCSILHRCNDSVMDYLMSYTVDMVILATGQSCVVYDHSPCSEKYTNQLYIG